MTETSKLMIMDSMMDDLPDDGSQVRNTGLKKGLFWRIIGWIPVLLVLGMLIYAYYVYVIDFCGKLDIYNQACLR